MPINAELKILLDSYLAAKSAEELDLFMELIIHAKANNGIDELFPT